MVCKTTSSSTSSASPAAFTLPEVLIASSLGLMLMTALILLWSYSAQSFVAIGNYLDLDAHSLSAIDKMTREIRQVDHLTSSTDTNLVFQDFDGQALQYAYNSNARTLTRVKAGATTTNLTECDLLRVSMNKRTPISNTFEPFSTSTATNAKLVQVTWTCSRLVLGAKVNTESVQSAKVVFRNK